MTKAEHDIRAMLEAGTLTLKRGAHSPDGEFCVMEAVSLYAGEPWSDSPETTSRVIATFMRSWNDSLPNDETRSRLLGPLIPIIANTRTMPEDEQRRSYMALDWLLRECAPTFLALTPGLVEHATALRGSPEVVDMDTAKAIGDKSRAAWAAAGAAAGAAAWDAAWDAARDAAWAAAWAAAGDAAWAAARDAAWAAAGDAAWAALKPAVESLQASAVLLVHRMSNVGRKP